MQSLHTATPAFARPALQQQHGEAPGPRPALLSLGKQQPASLRRQLSSVCRSTRQIQKQRDKNYEPEEDRPNRDYGPLPVRDASELFAEKEDAESLQFAIDLASQANDTKSVDIRVLDVSKLVTWTRYFVLATCFSKPQVDACITRMQQMAEGPEHARVLPVPPQPGTWVCLDYGDVVAHVFTPADRNHYDLEGYYLRAKEVGLPFETQKGM